MNIIVKNVSELSDHFFIESEDGVIFSMLKEDIKDYKPKVGDKLFLHTRLGSQIRGVDKEGKSIYFHSDTELERRHQIWKKNQKQYRIDRFIKQVPYIEKLYSLLPKILQHRILMLRNFIPNFRVECEFYEITAIFLAYKIYLHCGKIGNFDENLKKFDVNKYLRMHKILQEIGFSVNQVSYAMVFAKCLTDDVFEHNINISSPKSEDFLCSEVMMIPLALSPLLPEEYQLKQTFLKKYSKMVAD